MKQTPWQQKHPWQLASLALCVGLLVGFGVMAAIWPASTEMETRSPLHDLARSQLVHLREYPEHLNPGWGTSGRREQWLSWGEYRQLFFCVTYRHYVAKSVDQLGGRDISDDETVYRAVEIFKRIDAYYSDPDNEDTEVENLLTQFAE